VRCPLVLIATVLVALALAPSALAVSSGHLATVELVRSDGQVFTTRAPVSRFTLAGVQWRGSGNVVFRTRLASRRWSGWRQGAPEGEDGPDVGSAERRVQGWKIGNPWWVGDSSEIQARAVGEVSRVRAELVWSPETRIPLRVPASTVTPPIMPRATWGANESIRRGPPSYAPNVRFVIVHHTAGRNDYSRAEAPAIVRGIQLFHVQGNGWNDIGYNFLVDRFGTIYEGRYGGIDRNVVGAHALGFNTGSVGIALLGTYTSTAPSAVAQDAIARLIAWRLDLAHVDPTSFVTYVSGGSERYPVGVPVLLNGVSGHRDTGFTECPGDLLYARLGAIAAAARSIGGPKIFEPRIDVRGTSVRVRAQLSREQAWTVVMTDTAGVEAARGSGTGTAVDWTWESGGVAPGQYTWTVASGSARPASGVARAGGGSQPLAIELLVAEPEAISPNGDGQADTTTLTYRTTAPSNVSVEITDEVGGVVATVLDRVWTPAGEHSIDYDGAALADGNYNVVVTARTAAGTSVQKVIPLSVNRTLGLVTVSPTSFSPNADGRKDRLALTFQLAGSADVRVRVERDGRWVASPFFGSFVASTQLFTWDGMRSSGVIRDGEYAAVVEATGGPGVMRYSVPFVADTVAPRVRILAGTGVRVEVSEPAMLTFVIDGQSGKREVKRAGIIRIPWSGPVDRVRVVAWDAAGNASGPVVGLRRD
jgi:hypothetical protein